MLHTIVAEGLVDEAFVRDRTSGYAELERNVQGFSPEAMAPLCGIAAPTIREVARLYATSRASMILWGMGISQHVHGTDNARCLIALALLTGQIGRPGTGLHPLRGQNNVQGASDAGLIPMMYPDYQRVASPQARRRFERLWGTTLPAEPGLTVVEIIDAAHAGQVRGMYVMGENPAMSDPDAQHAREALARLECLVVQDIFLTETAGTRRRGAAGVGLPREDRQLHQHRPHGPARSPGLAAAGRGAAGPVDHRTDGARSGAGLELRGPRGGVRGDAQCDAVDRRHHLAAAGSRNRR